MIAAAPPAPDGARPRVGDRLAPAAVHLLGQGLGLLAVLAVGLASPWSLRHLLQEWDGQLYLQIARTGYAGQGQSGQDLHAFFPGYPLAVRAVSGVTALPLDLAAIAVSVASGIALAYGLDRLGAQLLAAPREVRLAGVFLAASFPLSVLFVMAYAEALFCALAVWALVWVGRRRWLAAGLAACAAGLVRPTGVALAVALAVAAAGAWRRGEPELVRALAACLLAPLGTAAYLLWAAVTTGHPDAWTRAQADSWGTTFDVGAFFVSSVWFLARHGPGPMEAAVLGGVAACAGALVWMVRRRLPAAVVAYVAGVLVLAVGTSGVWNSKYRIMMPALVVVAVLVASATSGWRTTARVGLLVAVAGVGAWFGAFAVVAYPHAL